MCNVFFENISGPISCGRLKFPTCQVTSIHHASMYDHMSFVSIISCIIYHVPFSALTLLTGWQEGHPACKESRTVSPKDSSLEDPQVTRTNLEWSPEKRPVKQKPKLTIVVVVVVVVVVIVTVLVVVVVAAAVVVVVVAVVVVVGCSSSSNSNRSSRCRSSSNLSFSMKFMIVFFHFVDFQPWNRIDTVGSSGDGWNYPLYV